MREKGAEGRTVGEERSPPSRRTRDINLVLRKAVFGN